MDIASLQARRINPRVWRSPSASSPGAERRRDVLPLEPASLPRLSVYNQPWRGVPGQANGERRRRLFPQTRCRSFPRCAPPLRHWIVLRLPWQIVLRGSSLKGSGKSIMLRCCGFRQGHSSAVQAALSNALQSPFAEASSTTPGYVRE
jgi:hypothetical protein